MDGKEMGRNSGARSLDRQWNIIQNPKQSAINLPRRLVHTGDIGTMSKEGYDLPG